MTGDFFQQLHEKHERLKKRIHSFRIPLSPRGQAIMKVVYFSIPVIGGYFIMEVSERRHASLIEFIIIHHFLSMIECKVTINQKLGKL